MLDLWSSRRTVFVQTASSKWIHIQFCCPVTCAAVVLWFFETILSARRSRSANVEFRPLFLLADVVFPWFVYAYITLEIVTLDTVNNAADFVTHVGLNAHQQSVLFQNQTSLPFSDSFTWTVTQHNHWCTDTNTAEEHSLLSTLVLLI
jgi:hypothetical protein